VAGDSFTVEVWTPSGLQRFVILFFMELSTRRAEIGGIARRANGFVFNNSIVLMLLVYWCTLVVHAIGLHGCERRSIDSLSSLPPSRDG
jgi:hypothetical protein